MNRKITATCDNCGKEFTTRNYIGHLGELGVDLCSSECILAYIHRPSLWKEILEALVKHLDEQLERQSDEQAAGKN